MATRRVSVRSVNRKEIQPLRENWLVDPGLLAAVELDGDDRSRTQHYGAIHRGTILGIVSLFNEPRPAMVEARSWRLQALAVDPTARGEGFGRSLIEGAERNVLRAKGNLIWANAPVASCDFFRAVNFEIAGDAFDVPEVGPHHRILLQLKK